MNRLVIIGNGFDLAHGLPTSYRDFIEEYYIKAMTFFFEERKYNDDLISINFKQNISFSNIPEFKNLENVFSFLDNYKTYIELIYNSSFFYKLTQLTNNIRWVDIENEYFNQLKSFKYKSHDSYDYNKVEKLNAEFYLIKILLEKYLIKTIKNYKAPINPLKYSRIFSDLIYKDEVLLKPLDENILPQNISILNFNYTPVVEVSVSNIKNIQTSINYIHGSLDNKENPIVFGFGDEFDKDYKNFEDQKNNSLFQHIKSYAYFKTENYHNLIRFIESDDYQVYIIGHSCGLSDRTMLKEIFENTKCKSIKIFYYENPDGMNDYTEKTMEISRHFDDKGLMRKKNCSFPFIKKNVIKKRLIYVSRFFYLSSSGMMTSSSLIRKVSLK